MFNACKSKKIDKLEFHGGLLGAFLPMILFVIVVFIITLKGLITMESYLGPLILVIALVIVLAKDKRSACEAMIDGVTDRTLAIIIFAFLGAGVLGTILVASGSVHAIVWIGYHLGVKKTLFTIASFVIASIVSTSTGTSTGTVVTCVPILYPAGVILGAHPALLLGAIYSGARFGDNIAPISDTTIASVSTQDAEMGDAVRSRLKYAFAAAGFSIILFLIFGSILSDTVFHAESKMLGAVDEYAKPEALVMVLAPIITIYLCLRRRPLIQAIWYGIIGGIIIGLLTRTLAVTDLYEIAPPQQVGGALTVGITGMKDVIFLTFFIMAIIGAFKKAGALNNLSVKVIKLATSVRKAELAIFFLVTLLYPLCAMNTPAILLAGPIVKEIGEKYRIHPSRRANLIDLAGNGITGNLPHINTILALAAAMVASSATEGIPLVPISVVGLLAFHPIMLTVVGLVAIATGWGFKTSNCGK
jgi:Na+/H+ antiporter NhaC